MQKGVRRGKARKGGKDLLFKANLKNLERQFGQT